MVVSSVAVGCVGMNPTVVTKSWYVAGSENAAT